MAEARRRENGIIHRGSGPGGRGPRRPLAGPPRRQGPPGVVWVFLALPALGIVGALGYRYFPRGAPEVKVETVDPNLELKALLAQVNDLERDTRAALALWRGEAPEARQKVEEMRDRLFRWIEKFDGILQPKRDAEDRLPPEYQGYEQDRSRINTLLSDLNKDAG